MEQLDQNNEQIDQKIQKEAPTTQAAKDQARFAAEMEAAKLRARLWHRSKVITTESGRRIVVEPTYIKPDEIHNTTNKKNEEWWFNPDSSIQPKTWEAIKDIPEKERTERRIIIKEDGTKIIHRRDGTMVTIKWPVNPA